MLKNIIWRRPFVTKRQRRFAKRHVNNMRTYETVLEECEKILNDPGLTPTQRLEIYSRRARVIVDMYDEGDRAAKYLGFRNIQDLMHYYDKHGYV